MSDPKELVVASSVLRVRTRAKGMLAALAHDLELRSTELGGRVTLRGDAWSAELAVPVASLRVAGTLHGDRLDASGLSPSDRAEVERKVREEVLPVASIDVRGDGTARDRGSLAVTFRSKATISVRIQTRASGGADELVVDGRGELSLKALGVREVKAPLGAFKIADAVEVLAEITLRPE